MYAACAVLLACGTAQAQDWQFKAAGRATIGASYRLEAPNPNLVNITNGAAVGVIGLTAGAPNADDSNLNFRRNDVTSAVLKAYIDLQASRGDLQALVRLKAWHDAALENGRRPWGNIPNNYAANAPLSDAGFAPLSRFSGAALADAWVQDRFDVGAATLTARLGQQSLNWGERFGFAGGLQALNAIDLPGMHRPGWVPQEARVPAPMLFARLDAAPGIAVEGFVQSRFRANALDGCGSFFSLGDFLADGCGRVVAGAPVVSDRARMISGSYVKRVGPPPLPESAQFGLGLQYKPWGADTELGAYVAQYTSRMAHPGLFKSSRIGAQLVAGDPDGKNLSYFIEYPDAVRMAALTVSHKSGATQFFGELTYRPNLPVQLAAADVLGAFVSTTSANVLRAEANALAPGAVFQGYDRFKTAQLQGGVSQDWGWALGSVEAVYKHAWNMPDPAKRRYGRADQFNPGPINGVCTVTTAVPALQCSFDGFATANSLAMRWRLDGRFPQVLPGLAIAPSLVFVNDMRGWSYDTLINEKRQTVNVSVKAEYRQRYTAELVLASNWGGNYNQQADRDLLSWSLGVKF